MFGRGNKGARKVNSEQVHVIRERYERGETQGSLAREFRLSVGQIGRIVRGESWQGSAGAAPPQDGALERLLAIQSEVQEMAAPLSPLDGGDAPAEGEGGLATLQERAKALGAK